MDVKRLYERFKGRVMRDSMTMKSRMRWIRNNGTLLDPNIDEKYWRFYIYKEDPYSFRFIYGVTTIDWLDREDIPFYGMNGELIDYVSEHVFELRETDNTVSFVKHMELTENLKKYMSSWKYRFKWWWMNRTRHHVGP